MRRRVRARNEPGPAVVMFGRWKFRLHRSNEFREINLLQLNHEAVVTFYVVGSSADKTEGT